MGATFGTSRSIRHLRSDGANDGGELSRARMSEVRYYRVERDVSNVASMARVRGAHARRKTQPFVHSHICTFAHFAQQKSVRRTLCAADAGGLFGKKLAATYSPAGVQYHRRDWA